MRNSPLKNAMTMIKPEEQKGRKFGHQVELVIAYQWTTPISNAIP